MTPSPDRSGQWETQAEIDAFLAEAGVTKDQVVRWRREGLLPAVRQVPEAYDGSVVLYPRGSGAQIRAAKALFEQKNRVDYVGLRLWRLGFPVDEKHWRPRLQQQGRMLDRVFPLLMRVVQIDSIELKHKTMYDYAAKRLEPGRRRCPFQDQRSD